MAAKESKYSLGGDDDTFYVISQEEISTADSKCNPR